MSQSKVAEPLVPILKNRVELARSLKLFHPKQIASNWEISPMTLLRYELSYYRELSRVDARARMKKNLKKGSCQLCTLPLSGHPRCPFCTILLHGKPTCDCASYFALK